MDEEFDRNVFINCPFDAAYLPILRTLIFGIFFLGFQPRIALERLNSAETRVGKIIELIRASRFSIHDLSRLKATRKGEFFRLNMPFELGLDIGCTRFAGAPWSRKQCLILETEPYRFQAAISDLSNSDIAVHGDDPSRALGAVRSWLVTQAGLSGAPGPAAIWAAFNDFMADHFDMLTANGHSAEEVLELPISELLPEMRRWIAARAR